MKTLVTLFVLGFANLIYAQDSNDIQIIDTYIEQHLVEWGLSESDVSGLIYTDFYQSRKSEIKHFYLRQAIDQIEIFNTNANAHIKDDQIIRFKQNFLSDINQNYNQKTSNITAEDAIRLAAQHLGQEQTFDLQVKEIKNQNNRETIYQGGAYAYDDINAKLSFYPRKNNLFISWEIAIYDVVTNKWWQVFVDATSGNILDKISWTVECSFDNVTENLNEHRNTTCDHYSSSLHNKASKENHNHSIANASTAVVPESYNVFALPYLSPLDGDRTLETAPWNDALNASPYGWHDTNGVAGHEYTTTRGNNVHAQEDRNGNNGTGTQTDGGPDLEFDFTFDEHAVPSTYTDFAVANLFYWNNVAHDIWYQYGFDEASGNFQFNNYGNGGSGSDEVRADAQDGSGTNNANFSSPPDGSNPRMQMFEWSAESFNTFTVHSPAGIARNYGAAGASFGPQDAVVTGDLVEADPILACGALNNGGAVSGNIAIIDRGSCNFASKVKNAQNAGAVAVIVCNNDNNPPSNMSGSDGTITIPSIMLSKMNCDTIKNHMPGVNVTIDVNSAVLKDSDLENGVILHEYGHGISIRLTGGPATSSCLSGSEQMGEGWSDWLGVVTTMQEGDIGPDTRGMGSYLKGQPLNDKGIRTYPYTTDMSINLHTYDDIKTESVPHGVGTVWCAMLWEMTWALIDVYGFDADVYGGTGGNNIAMELVIEGMKLQGCNPGFVDGRDAILLADANLNGGVNQCLIWEAFAKRGLGWSAVQGSSSSRSDGTEAFDTPPFCDAALSIVKSAAMFVESGTDLPYSITVTNNDTIVHTNLVILDTLQAGLSVVGGTLTCNGTINGDIISMTHPSLDIGNEVNCFFDVTTNDIPNSPLDFFDGVENGTSNWTVSSGQGTGVFTTSIANPHVGNTSWFIPNVAADNSQYLTSNTLLLGNVPILVFTHDYDTELGWDGGMVEISTDGGSNWNDLADEFFFNGYNGSLGNSSNSDIFGRAAFTGDSNGYLTSYINLEAYANQNAQIRFFFGSDDNTIEHGWYIDQIILYEGNFIVNNVCLTTAQGGNECDDITTFVRKECDVPFVVYEDADGDQFGNPNSTLLVCAVPSGYVLDNTDCDDTESQNFPGNTEICGDGIDNNCDNVIDEGCMMFPCDGDSLFINMITQDDYHALDYVNSDVLIESPESIVYTAGIDIDLIGDFEVELGADFHAYISTCTVLMRLEGEVNPNDVILEEDENWLRIISILEQADSKIEIYNTNKQILHKIDRQITDKSELKDALNKLDKGIYFISVKSTEENSLIRYLNF